MHPHQAQIAHKKYSILYRNQTIKENENEEEESRRKEIEVYDIVIAPKRNKDKQFKVEVPITKGNKWGRHIKSSDIFFRFSFNNSEGTSFCLLRPAGVPERHPGRQDGDREPWTAGPHFQIATWNTDIDAGQP